MMTRNVNGKLSGRPIFLMSDNGEYADRLVCDDCPLAVEGKFPAWYVQECDGVVCSPCIKYCLGQIANWQGHNGLVWRDKLLPLKLFKCKRNFWFVIEGVE